MNNLFLTTLCNGRCPYCFGQGRLKHRERDCAPGDFLSLPDARAAASFFRATGEISFLGGEPTLHPRFREICGLFLEAGFKIFLFTNGKFDRETRDYLRGRDGVFSVVNVNEPASYRAGEWEALCANLSALRGRINSLALTFYRPGQPFEHVVDLARRFGVKAVKIGVAAPNRDGGNRSVPFEKKRLLVGTFLDLVAALGRAGIISCGECEKFKPCMIDHPARQQIRLSGWQGALFINKQCRQGGNLDVGPDLTVYRCFSFPESLGKKLTDFSSPAEMREYSRKKYEKYFFKYYPLEACRDCEYALRRECEGGCLTRIFLKHSLGRPPAARTAKRSA